MKKNRIMAGIFLAFIGKMSAQDLGQIGKSPPVKLTGSVSANQILYNAYGIDNRRAPYNYFLTGNLNVALYGWNIPLSFTYSNQKSQFQQPFNQLSFTPYYKWVKLYAGYTSMSFSPYTLNGHIFLGGGVQLTPPGLFRVSTMFGRLNKAVEEDTTSANIIPTFERWGGGIKVGVGKNNDNIDLIFFMAKDDPRSLKKFPEKNDVLPGENVVVSAIFSKGIFDRVVFSGEYAQSAVTTDTRASEARDKYISPINFVPGFKVRSSTSFHSAFNSRLTYAVEGFSLGIGYERIDPGYRTFGAYYFNDDMQNYTLNSTKQFGTKVNLSLNVGVQQNNLSGEKMSGMNRYIGSVNVGYSPNPRVALNGGYSNFQTFTRVKQLSQLENSALPQELNGNPDTLNYIQLTQSANASANYIISSPSNKTRRSTITCLITYQTAGEKRSNTNLPSAGTHFFNNHLNFSYSLLPIGLTLSFGINNNVNRSAAGQIYIAGPVASASKTFLNKTLKTSGSLSWSNTFIESRKINDVFNSRLGITYTLKKKHSFNGYVTVIYKNGSQTATAVKSFTEVTFNSGYSYNF